MSYLSPYRGSKYRKKKWLRILLLSFILILALFVAAFFLLQEHIIYLDDGTFRFDFSKTSQSPPVRNEEQTDPEPEAPFVVGDESSSLPPAEQAPDVPPSSVWPEAPLPSEDTLQTAVRYTARLVTPQSLLDGTGLQDGYDSIAVNVKDEDGICWVKDPMQAPDGTAENAAAFQDALSKLDCRKIAVITALRDPIRPRNTDRSYAMKVESGAIWLDWDYSSWFDPHADGTVTYLQELIANCKDAGFDEVVLTGLQYPTRGKPQLIYSSSENPGRMEAITSLAEALSDAEIPVSCLLTENAAKNGTDEAASQSAPALAAAFGKVFIPVSSTDDITLPESLIGKDKLALWFSDSATGDSPFDRILHK